ncbi:MAG: hypothetical protein PHV02_18140 [Rhodocyclaceae bacterium]|nr:hypothetical protein [Rhodocyclaceae bacterium]
MERKPYNPDDIWDESTEPPLELRVSAALFVLAMGGSDAVGGRTLYALMWPHKPYYVTEPSGRLRLALTGDSVDDKDVDGEIRRMAAKTLASVHNGLIAALPPDRYRRISTDLNIYLSVACGDGSLDETILSQESE